VFVSSPDLVYTVFAAVFVALIGMCVQGYLAIKPLCKALFAPETLMSPFVVLFCFVAVFTAPTI
jgi:putative tricarboxylic transport membrane protein